MVKRIDITGRQFGDLKVIKLSNKRGQNNTLLWECECICGNIIYLLGSSLLHGIYKSCGCKRDLKRDNGLKNHIQHDAIDGTRKSALKAKLHKNNKSGHKGVIWLKTRKKWKAQIGFKNKVINLGYFNDKEDAIKARKMAEEKYHKPYLNNN